MTRQSCSQVAADEDEQELSEPAPYQGFPPRLSVCLNEVTVMDREIEGVSPGARMEPDARPLGSDGKDLIKQVAAWCVDLLRMGDMDAVWASSAGRPDWTPDDPVEERWAKHITELVLGTAYGGPDITAGFREPRIREGFGGGVVYILQRFQRESIPWTTLGEHWASVKNRKLASMGHAPENVELIEPIPNDDPACSLYLACQYMTTYAVLSRGFTIEEHLNGIGLPARQCDKFWIFSSDDDENLSAGAPGAWYPTPEAQQTVATALEKGQAIGPGTVYTFNPIGNLPRGYVRVPVEEAASILISCMREDGTLNKARAMIMLELANSRRIEEVKQSERALGRDLKGLSTQLNAKLAARGMTGPKGGEHIAAKLIRDLGNTIENETTYFDEAEEKPISVTTLQVQVDLRAQLPGSHISCVLRRWNVGGVEMVQLLDTNLHDSPVAGATKGAEAIPLVAPLGSAWDRGGVVDGNPLSMITPGPGTRFVGLGTLPPAPDLEAMVDHLRKVRPVGLARLVVALDAPRDPKAPWWNDTFRFEHILFISRGALTWGTGPTENYTIPRYLLSLRDIPYHRDVRAYWMLYAPRSELADVLWAPGARTRNLEALVEDARARRAARPRTVKKGQWIDPPPLELNTSDALKPVALLASQADGKVGIAWQGHDLKQSNLGGGRGSPPEVLRRILLAPSWSPLDVGRVKPDGDFTDLDAARKDVLQAYVSPSIEAADPGSALELPDYLSVGAT